MATTVDALERLARVDAAARAAGLQRETLDPARGHARDLQALGLDLLRDETDAAADATADALASIVEAQHAHFPGNIFADFDYLASVVLRAARGADGATRARDLRDRVVDLFQVFGCHSPIRFRYGHDFAYGFDWERWVRRDPDARAGIGPFDTPFLEHMRERGHEITHAIRTGDPGYPVLDEGAWRNPFPFSREPEHEVRLFRDLAAHDAIPVRAWRADATPNWQVDASRLRVERARALDLPPTND